MTLSQACGLFGISRQAIYKQQKGLLEKSKKYAQIKTMIRHHRIAMPRLGTRKLYYLLKHDFNQNNIKIGRDGLFALLRREHMLVKPAKSYTKTTWSKHWLHKHPNLSKQMLLHRAEQLWVSDITYVKTRKQNCYLSLVTDAYSRKIMGYHVSDNLKTESVAEALKMAVSKRIHDGSLTHHSDRGLQYCAEPYQNILKKYGLTCSMTDGYDCYQNALAERINGILKNEFLLNIPADLEELKKMVTQTVAIYNNQRPHLRLNMKTPAFIHQQKSLTD